MQLKVGSALNYLSAYLLRISISESLGSVGDHCLIGHEEWWSAQGLGAYFVQ